MKRVLAVLRPMLVVTSPCWGLPLFFVMIQPAYRARVNAIPFDVEAWRADAEAYPSRRLDMAADLRRRYRLVGMTPVEVEALLGHPSANHLEHWGIYEYNLGADRYTLMLGPDNAFLLLRFENGRVVRVWQETG
jgi:hypothetical protein